MTVQENQLEVQRLRQQDLLHVWHPLTQHQAYRDGGNPLLISGGAGALVHDIEGNTYIDAAAGLWCVNVGYGRMELVNAAVAQMTELAYFPLTQSHAPAIKLSAKLAEYLPELPYYYYSNSGSEANEAAFKAVRQYWKQKGYPGKVKILSRHRGYHGTTMGALAATGQSERRRDYEPLAGGFIQVAAPYCYRCPFYLKHPGCGLQCALDFERRIVIEGPDTVAAIIVEPIIAGGGVVVPPEDYLAHVATIAKRYNVKLIVDEVVTGFGRTGRMFAHQAAGVTPDIVTMAKGLASGYMPIGATAFSSEIYEAFLEPDSTGRHLRHVNTFSGHPVATAVALANIEVIEQEQLCEQSRQNGEFFLDCLREQVSSLGCVGEVRGLGLLAGVELIAEPVSKVPVNDAFMKQLAKALIGQGIVAGKATDVETNHNNVLMFAPPLVITREQIEQVVQGVRNALVALTE